MVSSGDLGRGLEDRPADHHRDDLLDLGVGGPDGIDVAAVAHDRDAVGDLLQLLQAVGDVDDAHALTAQLASDAEELVDLRIGQRGRRLVHDQDGGVERERLGDLDHLLLGDGQCRGPLAGIEAETQLLEEGGGADRSGPVRRGRTGCGPGAPAR